VQCRRSAPPAQAVVEVEGLRVDPVNRVAERDGRPIHLTPTEWELLGVLLRQAGRLLSHARIFREVWPGSGGDAQAYLRVHISNLRRKLERDPLRPSLIITDAGVGYRFRALDRRTPRDGAFVRS
jgi:two-component system, OmpR family, KDP operon response regulator KdpE